MHKYTNLIIKKTYDETTNTYTEVPFTVVEDQNDVWTLLNYFARDNNDPKITFIIKPITVSDVPK